MKLKIEIPVVVTRSGAVSVGSFWRHSDGSGGKMHGIAIDSLAETDYETGYQIVTVKAEIDVDALFVNHTIEGSVRGQESEG
jgi:phosphoribosylaminoimidazole-succinocarboxamide synthase